MTRTAGGPLRSKRSRQSDRRSVTGRPGRPRPSRTPLRLPADQIETRSVYPPRIGNDIPKEQKEHRLTPGQADQGRPARLQRDAAIGTHAIGADAMTQRPQPSSNRAVRGQGRHVFARPRSKGGTFLFNTSISLGSMYSYSSGIPTTTTRLPPR